MNNLITQQNNQSLSNILINEISMKDMAEIFYKKVIIEMKKYKINKYLKEQQKLFLEKEKLKNDNGILWDKIHEIQEERKNKIEPYLEELNKTDNFEALALEYGIFDDDYITQEIMKARDMGEILRNARNIDEWRLKFALYHVYCKEEDKEEDRLRDEIDKINIKKEENKKKLKNLKMQYHNDDEIIYDDFILSNNLKKEFIENKEFFIEIFQPIKNLISLCEKVRQKISIMMYSADIFIPLDIKEEFINEFTSRTFYTNYKNMNNVIDYFLEHGFQTKLYIKEFKDKIKEYQDIYIVLKKLI